MKFMILITQIAWQKPITLLIRAKTGKTTWFASFRQLNRDLMSKG